MALFKRKKEETDATKTEAQAAAPVVAVPVTDNEGWAFGALTAPHITEKGSLLNAVNQYVFRVPKGINKSQIARSIEKLYKVSVVKVRTIHLPSKKRRIGRFQGVKPGIKKAIISLKKGDIIASAKSN